MNLPTWSVLAAAGLGWSVLTACGQEAPATNAPVSTQAVAVAAAPADPAAEGWLGTVRVLRDERGDVRAVRLVTGDKLLAIELNEKGRELAKTPKTEKLLVSGSLDVRDGRSWLVVTDFRKPPEVAPAPPPAPAAPAAAAPASTQAVAEAAAVTNAAPVK